MFTTLQCHTKLENPNKLTPPSFAHAKQGNLYLTGNGMSERSAVRQLPQSLTGSDGIDVISNNNDSRSDTNAKNGALPLHDVVVVERCHDLHNEQVHDGIGSQLLFFQPLACDDWSFPAQMDVAVVVVVVVAVVVLLITVRSDLCLSSSYSRTGFQFS